MTEVTSNKQKRKVGLRHRHSISNIDDRVETHYMKHIEIVWRCI